MYIYIYILICIYIYIYECICVCVCARVCACVCVHMSAIMYPVCNYISFLNLVIGKQILANIRTHMNPHTNSTSARGMISV